MSAYNTSQGKVSFASLLQNKLAVRRVNETSFDAQAHNFYNTLYLYCHASSYMHLVKVVV